METNNATISEKTKELLQQFVITDNEFIKAAINESVISEKILTAENLGLKDDAYNLEVENKFIRNRMFFLHLRLTRIFNLLIREQSNFHQN